MIDKKLIEVIYTLAEKCSQHRNRHLKELGLSKAEFRGLMRINEKQKITCREFSERMGLSLSRGSRIVDKLYQRNYILRAGSSSDRRCKMIQLTEKGKKVRGKIAEEMNKCEQKLISEMSDAELKQLKKDLKALIEKL